MKFKSFTWPNNPSSIELISKNNVKEIQVPYSGCVLQNFGLYPRRITGKGEFFGKASSENFSDLQTLFKEGGEGMLNIPGIEPMQAVFKKLVMLEKSSPDNIEYEFEFVENISSSGKNEIADEKYCTCETDQSFWNIAAKYDIAIDELMKLNPAAKNPWDIFAGERVRIG